MARRSSLVLAALALSASLAATVVAAPGAGAATRTTKRKSTARSASRTTAKKRAATTKRPAPTTTSAPATTAAPAATAAPATSAAPATTVAKAAPVLLLGDSKLGKILTDAKGRTVYLWNADDASRPTSKCADACATVWPPVTVPKGTTMAVGEGLDASKLGVQERVEGTFQVTYDRWPLYYFLPDGTEVGATKGQGSTGFGALWLVLNADGKPVRS